MSSGHSSFSLSDDGDGGELDGATLGGLSADGDGMANSKLDRLAAPRSRPTEPVYSNTSINARRCGDHIAWTHSNDKRGIASATITTMHLVAPAETGCSSADNASPKKHSRRRLRHTVAHSDSSLQLLFPPRSRAMRTRRMVSSEQ